MIECFSDTNWLNPQINFLLILQNLRICHFNMFNDLFLSITIVGEFWLPTVVCAIVYWCMDMKSGVYLFSLLAFNMFFAHLFKMLACVYRPWVLSDKIHPVDKALTLAAGYSFPSGHSAQSSAFLGGLAFLQQKRMWLVILLISLVFLVGFSRMWLGVHTPQDVIIGFLIGFSLVFIINNLINWAEQNKNRYLYLLGLINITIIGTLIYLCYFNSYPVDYVNGKILVDSRHSLQVTIFCYGCIAGILSGVFLCRKYFQFNMDLDLKTKIWKGLTGSFFVIILFKLVTKYIFCNACDFKMVYLLSFLGGFFITAIYPVVFELLHRVLIKSR